MAKALAAEVADFEIKVTIIAPGAFRSEFQSSIQSSRTIAEYDAVREKLWAMFTPDMFGDPEATSEALIKVVDANEPPLRLVLGSCSLPIIREIYGHEVQHFALTRTKSDE
jgi:NAD(P)-dependent dehydrogenase (short-subunit alcohol dehydrogenase family)